MRFKIDEHINIKIRQKIRKLSLKNNRKNKKDNVFYTFTFALRRFDQM